MILTETKKEPRLSYLFAARFNKAERNMIGEMERVQKISRNTVIRRAVRLAHALEARKAALKRA